MLKTSKLKKRFETSNWKIATDYCNMPVFSDSQFQKNIENKNLTKESSLLNESNDYTL